MFQYLAYFITLCASMHAARPSLPPLIQFQPSKTPPAGDITSGNSAFNGAPEMTPFFEMLKKIYQITTVIETGTYQGGTTAFFARTFDEVHTIDISPDFLTQSKENLSPLSNIQFHLGSSEKILSQILPALKEKFVLFYLDAHWKKYWPLLDEIEEINKTHHQRCIIVIDDIKVPGRTDIPYDAYKKHECSFEYVKAKIEKTFDSYTTLYLLPANSNSRAKLVIIPN